MNETKRRHYSLAVAFALLQTTPDCEPFPVLDTAWSTPELLETDQAGDAYSPQVVIDSTGTVTAAWNQHDGDHYNVLAARWTGTWSEPVEIDDAPSDNAFLSDVEIDSAGNVAVLWTQKHEGPTVVHRLRCRLFEPGAGWGSVDVLEQGELWTTTGSAIAFDPNDQLVVTWPAVWSRRQGPSGWSDAERIGSTGGLTRVVVDPAGMTTAIWHAQGGAVYAARADSNAWQGELFLGPGLYPELAVDPAGKVTAVWWRRQAGLSSVWAARYDQGWQAPQLLEQDDDHDAESPQVVVGPGGIATAAWIQRDGIRWNLWAARHELSWGPPELVETGDAHAWNPVMVVDSSGVVTMVWLQDGSLWMNRHDLASWGIPELVEHEPGNVSYPDLAVDSDGTVVAVWPQDDGERYSIRSSRWGVE